MDASVVQQQSRRDRLLTSLHFKAGDLSSHPNDLESGGQGLLASQKEVEDAYVETFLSSPGARLEIQPSRFPVKLLFLLLAFSFWASLLLSEFS